jgi:hypothetical protein
MGIETKAEAVYEHLESVDALRQDARPVFATPPSERECTSNLARSARSVFVALALTLVVSLPMQFAPYPLLYDYPFHLARLLVLNDF